MGNTAQMALGLGGLPGAAQAIQGVIHAELLGVDLAAFGAGDPTTEAMVRRDPGAASATLTFIKSGQSMPLPLDLAQALIGQSTGSARIAVELLFHGPDGALGTNLRRLSGVPIAPTTLPGLAPSPGSVAFSNAGSVLASAVAALTGLEPWSNAISTLSPPGSLDLLVQPPPVSRPRTEAGQVSGATRHFERLSTHFEASLASLAPGAGIGYERALARISTMGPEMARASSEALARFPQSSSGPDSTGPWLAQQAMAQEAGRIEWSGTAWAGAPMSITWGRGNSSTPEAQEARKRVDCPEGSGLAWMRFRIDPEGLGPIDVWAVLLGGGRCLARLRACPQARAHIEHARRGFSSMLEAARVDLALSFDPETPHES